MQRVWLEKALIVGVILVILKLVLMSIDGVVGERQSRQQQIVNEIASSNYGAQLYGGPVLMLPYTEEYVVLDAYKQPETRREERILRIFPATSSVEGEVGVGTKSRGLFKVRVFDWNARSHGEFLLRDLRVERNRSDSKITWGDPYISLTLGDPRGLIGAPILKWNGQTLNFQKGSGSARPGLHAMLPAVDTSKPQRFAYDVQFTLRGTQSLAILPLADDNSFRLSSPWPHPSFGGQFLPNSDTQRVSKDGFNAQWNISSLASAAQQQILSQGSNLDHVDRVEVRFIEPIDIYSLSDRALKYGFLFILLTFCCFLLFEVLKRLLIHPAQYLMVGLALATFFLLLVALSEHVLFWIAYAGASLACVGLLAIYLSAVLRSALRGTVFGILLTALYGALYGLLISEDNALLLGAILVFAVLSLAMLATRKVDWYALTNRAGPPVAS